MVRRSGMAVLERGRAWLVATARGGGARAGQSRGTRSARFGMAQKGQARRAGLEWEGVGCRVGRRQHEAVSRAEREGEELTRHDDARRRDVRRLVARYGRRQERFVAARTAWGDQIRRLDFDGEGADRRFAVKETGLARRAAMALLKSTGADRESHVSRDWTGAARLCSMRLVASGGSGSDRIVAFASVSFAEPVTLDNA